MSRLSRSALIVSDSAPLRQYTASILGAVGVDAIQAENGFHAMDRFAERSFDLFVMDLDMPSSDGLTILAISLTNRNPDQAIIGLGQSRDDSLRSSPWADIIKLAAQLPKPFHPDDFIAAVGAALKGRS